MNSLLPLRQPSRWRKKKKSRTPAYHPGVL